MTCYDCHNRAGHAIPNPRTGIDYQLSTGAIDPTLPFIKREGMRILSAGYPNLASADAEADRLEGFYQQHYPLVFQTKAAQINAAIDEIKVLYRLTATPEMKVSARTYPDNLGHMDFPGCFRCHDGGHCPRRQRGRDHEDDPVHLRHLPHLPADRAGDRQPAARRATRDARPAPVRVQPQERGHEHRPRRHDLR